MKKQSTKQINKHIQTKANQVETKENPKLKKIPASIVIVFSRDAQHGISALHGHDLIQIDLTALAAPQIGEDSRREKGQNNGKVSNVILMYILFSHAAIIILLSPL